MVSMLNEQFSIFAFSKLLFLNANARAVDSSPEKKTLIKIVKLKQASEQMLDALPEESAIHQTTEIKKKGRFSNMKNYFGFGFGDKKESSTKDAGLCRQSSSTIKTNSLALINKTKTVHGALARHTRCSYCCNQIVNSVANILSTHTHKTTLRFVPQAQGTSSFNGDILGFDKDAYSDESWERLVNIGSLQFGAPHEIVIPMKVPAGESPYLEAVITFPMKSCKQKTSKAKVDSYEEYDNR